MAHEILPQEATVIQDSSAETKMGISDVYKQAELVADILGKYEYPEIRFFHSLASKETPLTIDEIPPQLLDDGKVLLTAYMVGWPDEENTQGVDYGSPYTGDTDDERAHDMYRSLSLSYHELQQQGTPEKELNNFSSSLTYPSIDLLLSMIQPSTREFPPDENPDMATLKQRVIERISQLALEDFHQTAYNSKPARLRAEALAGPLIKEITEFYRRLRSAKGFYITAERTSVLEDVASKHPAVPKATSIMYNLMRVLVTKGDQRTQNSMMFPGADGDAEDITSAHKELYK